MKQTGDLLAQLKYCIAGLTAPPIVALCNSVDSAAPLRQAAAMLETVALPVWFVVCAGVLAAIGLLDRVIGPSLRWVFRRRVNRAIDRLNARLSLRIQPFKLTKRQVLIERLTYDAEVMRAVEIHAEETGAPREAVVAQVEGYAREIVPAFSAYAYFSIGARVSKWIARTFYRVRLGAVEEEALGRINPDSTVIFVMNHRSNFDYLLVTFLAARASALSYAVGEWARVWPLSRIVRAMGAYFIRRKSRSPLYRKVLARYVHMATAAGVTQAVFPEGGLSRDGRLAPPKLGLLSYIVQGFDREGERDVVFVPVGLNYDRVIEDRVLLSARDPEVGARAFRVSFASALRYSGRLLWRRLTGRFYRFGYACVSFGAPLSLQEFLAEQHEEDVVDELARTLMNRVGDVIPVLPVSLLSEVFLGATAPLSELDLKRRTAETLDALLSRGAHCHLPRSSLDYAVDVGLRMLTMRRIVEETSKGFVIAEGEDEVLRYYANAIGQHTGASADPVPV
ncbi:MAG: 1-acyl-sn-glycerol-3-phosphate acyltransferase, partial [Pseudomonadota bacterium]